MTTYRIWIAMLFGTFLFAFSTSPAFAQQPNLSGGGWRGYWVSDKNGHNGPLRARFRQIDANTYRVTYAGRFWKVVPFVYSVRMNVTGQQGDTLFMSGQTNVGPLVGSFSYEGYATPFQYESRFRSRNDHGRFVLSR